VETLPLPDPDHAVHYKATQVTSFRIARVLPLGWIVLAVACHEASGLRSIDCQAVAAPPEHDRSLSTRLVEDARDGCLDEFGLLTAALIAGGVGCQSELDECCVRFNEIRARSRGHAENTVCGLSIEGSQIERVRALFRFMHREILTGDYQVNATQLSRTLQSGSYNCVTATILFNCLCEVQGLRATAVATRGHVFSRIHGEEPVDIQTTSPDWFASLAESDQDLPQIQGGSKMRWRSGREINAVQLIGKIYYNRAVAELTQNHFAEAVDSLELSLELDPEDPSAHQNLLAALNNWSLHECHDGNFGRAAELVEQGVSIGPDYAPLRVNDLHIHQKWIVSLCEQDRYEAALRLLERGYARRPETELFDHGRFAVYGLWAESLFRQGRTDSAWELLADARRRFSDRSGWLPYEANAIDSAAQEVVRHRDLRQAEALLKRGLELQPTNGTLQQRLQDLAQGDS